MNKAEWVWMPHAGHFIGGNECRFHLNTYVGGVVVSTVGEWDPMRKGFEDIGLHRRYETMVFRARSVAERRCCPWEMDDAAEVDFEGYNDPEEATDGHMRMCEKWATTGSEVMA